MRRRNPSLCGRRRAFTLVELMVVVGIIAVLIAILMPAMGKAREQARRAVCASNLRQIGTAAVNFAGSHGGRFPQTFRPYDPAAENKRMPMALALGDALDSEASLWKTYGTPLATWAKLGAPIEVWKCPSSPFEPRYYNTPGGVTATNWGQLVWTDYMYLGGLTASTLGDSRGRWGLLVPAVRLHDKAAPNLLLAADGVFYAGGPTYPWARKIQINHATPTDPTRVDYQAVLYGDGHVLAQGREMYPKTIPADRGNYSLLHDGKTSDGGFFYWGAAMSWTPGKAVPPPAAPAAPTTGSPKPPPPPPPPGSLDPLP